MHVRHARRNSRLTVTLIRPPFFRRETKEKVEEKKEARSTKVSKHGSENVKGEAAGKPSTSSQPIDTLNIFHRLQLRAQTFWGGAAKPQSKNIFYLYENGGEGIRKVKQTLR
ncbi:hypothetical protein PUN28_014387 [Cardiocondyla obscurior]|uniref:Uncharacterized protein n=1 Tax=Cardiocondyla obscurior TaxID=286306 RepID=A0AAW2F161_9HYME